MKVTRRQLRRIIREEKQNLLKEGLHGVIAGIGFSSPPSPSPSIYSSQSAQSPAALAMKRSRSAQQNRPRISEERKTIEFQGDEWHDAWDDLNEGLVNLIANALDAGLLEDDINDAWGETKTYVRDMMGGY